MSDFLALRTRILDELARTDLTSQAALAIHSSVDHYKYHHFWFNEAYATLSAVASQEWYDLPDRCVGVESLKMTQSGSDYILEPMQWDLMEARRLSTSVDQGLPKYFCMRDSQLRLYPVPNDTYVMTMAYTKDLSELTASSSTSSVTNGWTEEGKGEELIRLRSKIDLLENVIQEDQGIILSGRLRQREAEVYANLKRQLTQFRGSGRVRPIFF